MAAPTSTIGPSKDSPTPTTDPTRNSVYKELLPQQIRILHLHPAALGRHLKGSLETITLSREGHISWYEGLSYACGTEANTQEIRIQGLRVEIRPRLHAALMRLRNAITPRILWVDQICINEENKKERGHQIKLMGDIYQCAWRVNVWLGEPGVHSYFRFTPLLTSWTAKREYEAADILQILRWNVTHHRARMKSIRGHGELLEFALRGEEPHWDSRAWIVQEFRMAQKVCLCYGRIEMNLNLDVLRALHHVERETGNGSVDGDTESHMRRLIDRLEDLEGPLNRTLTERRYGIKQDIRCGSLFQVLKEIGPVKSGKRRDRIRAIQSLITKEEADFIGYDETQSAGELFARATAIGKTKVWGYENDHSHLDSCPMDDSRFIEYPKDIGVDLEQNWPHDLPDWAIDFSKDNSWHVLTEPSRPRLYSENDIM